MEKFNPTETWLNNVAVSHSDSESTSRLYRQYLKLFCQFLGKTPKQILDDYEATTDREFKRRYAEYLRAYTSSLFKQEYSPNTIRSAVSTVKSFFKYNDLPLAYVPIAKSRVMYHNRDISHDEIKLIVDSSRPREKAFYLIMAQGGLRPSTISLLRYKHIKEDFEKGVVPLSIKVPEEIAKGEYRPHFTFIGEDGVDFLKAHLNTMPSISDEDYIFVNQGTRDPANPKSLTGLFLRTVLKLQEKGLMEVYQKEKGKPRDVRLYNLRKFFRKYATPAGVDYVNFWMGHTANYKAPHIPASDEAYFPTEDVEFHRKLYTEKAQPHLRIYEPTALETDEVLQGLRSKIGKLTEEKKELENRLSGALMVMEDQRKTMDDKYNDLLKMFNKLKDGYQKELEELRKKIEKK